MKKSDAISLHAKAENWPRFPVMVWEEGKELDTHLGSGSSAIAAHYFGVDFVGCELDKDYFEAAKARFDMATKQLAMSI